MIIANDRRKRKTLMETWMDRPEMEKLDPVKRELLMRAYRPVSYTHLDVYKRQPFGLNTITSFLLGLLAS